LNYLIIWKCLDKHRLKSFKSLNIYILFSYFIYCIVLYYIIYCIILCTVCYDLCCIILYIVFYIESYYTVLYRSSHTKKNKFMKCVNILFTPPTRIQKAIPSFSFLSFSFFFWYAWMPHRTLVLSSVWWLWNIGCAFVSRVIHFQACVYTNIRGLLYV